MKLPQLQHPDRYRGLYVYDFGDWTAVGYTAEEIAILLESEATRGGAIYKIHRAWPDGRMELRGVPPERFKIESGMFFCRGDQEQAATDYAELINAARQTPPPCRTFVHLAERPGALPPARFVTALIFPAEYEDEIAQWLLRIDYQGGDLVEGGPSHVTDYYAGAKTIIRREQLWSQASIPSRSADEVMSSIRRAVQR